MSPVPVHASALAIAVETKPRQTGGDVLGQATTQ